MNVPRGKSGFDVSNESKPLSAWERRKLYSKQMYNRQREVNKNSVNRTSLSRIDSEKPEQPSSASIKAKRKLSLVESEDTKEKPLRKKHKSVGNSLFLEKKFSVKQKWQTSDGKENSKPKISPRKSFPVHRTSRQRSVRTVTAQGSEHPPSKPLCRSASFTIDKESNEINSTEEINKMEICCENKDTLSSVDLDKKERSDAKKPAIVEVSCNDGSSKPKKHSVAKDKSFMKTPLKSGRGASLLVKKDKFIKPDISSGRKMTQREKLATWKHQQNKSISGNSRRMTCAPSILRSIKQQDVKQTPSDAKPTKTRRTLSSVNILQKESKMINATKFTVISSNLQEQDVNSTRLSANRGKNMESNTRSVKERSSSYVGIKTRRTRSNVAANLEKSVTSKKASLEEKSISENDNIKNSDAKEVLNEQTENHTDASCTPHIASSRKKSVCFDVPLCGSTPGKTLPKTPKRDLTLRERLQQWLDNKGRSISSFRHVKCFGYHLSNMKPKESLSLSCSHADSENAALKASNSDLGESPVLRSRPSNEQSLDSSSDDAHASNERNLDSSSDASFDVNEVLVELKELLAHGHPTKDTTEWLDELVKCIPAVEDNPQYWICRSSIAELQSGVNGAISVYHEALDKKVQHAREKNEDATYAAEICKALEGLLRRYAGNSNKSMRRSRTPRGKGGHTLESIHQDTPREPLINQKYTFNSTVIKYGVAYSTPGSCKSVKAVVTPVRRSARLSHTPAAKLPQAITEVDSVSDLPKDIQDSALFRENEALIQDCW